MEEAKIIITKEKEGLVTIEGENVSPLEMSVMCHAMVKETAERLGQSFDVMLALLSKANEIWEKGQGTGMLS